MPKTRYHRLTIEHGQGETYTNSGITVYGHYPYERSSVLYGRWARCYLHGDFESVGNAIAWIEQNHPDVPWEDMTESGGSSFIHDDLSDIPDEPDLQ